VSDDFGKLHQADNSASLNGVTLRDLTEAFDAEFENRLIAGIYHLREGDTMTTTPNPLKLKGMRQIGPRRGLCLIPRHNGVGALLGADIEITTTEP